MSLLFGLLNEMLGANLATALTTEMFRMLTKSKNFNQKANSEIFLKLSFLQIEIEVSKRPK
jgi:hypothetical protein